MYIYKISNSQARRIYTTYLLQSVDMLMGIAGDGGDGAHVHRLDGAGQALEAPARRLFRLRTPPQHDDGSALAFPVAYGMHGASAEPTCPHVMAADADATSAAAAMTTANATTACILLFFIIKAIVIVLLLSIAPAKLSKC